MKCSNLKLSDYKIKIKKLSIIGCFYDRYYVTMLFDNTTYFILSFCGLINHLYSICYNVFLVVIL